uniref:Uncharacterized protein n=1 Tax=Anguilla anguilla TaxID=7936 RepID=A0A0E9XZ58_ANGAN
MTFNLFRWGGGWYCTGLRNRLTVNTLITGDTQSELTLIHYELKP